MAGRKYEKHIVTSFAPGLDLPEFRGKPGQPTERSHFMMWLGDKVVKGSPYVEAVWLWPAATDPKGGFPQHVHASDEIIGFFGTDTGKVLDLGGEIEFWLEDEMFILTKSFQIYIPADMVHNPLRFHRFDRPMFHLTLGNAHKYV